MAERGPAYNFWRRMKTEQANREWTDSELHRRSGVSRNTIKDLGTRTRVEAGTISALADALDIPRAEAYELAGIVPPADEQGEVDTEAADAREAILRDPTYNEEQREAMLRLHDLFARANRGDS
ncbi:helix-turn-helix domain-containing protein [Micromonospora sp. NPDC048930]|uniref:helix-turn-helix domain-containing protein n=1 Tax=Micromonospora sp. NPDC048930 TaxID=3364261 RepID=UPI003718ADF5